MFSGKDIVTRFIAQSVQEEDAGKDLLAERMFGKVFWKYQVLVLWFGGEKVSGTGRNSCCGCTIYTGRRSGLLFD